MDAIISGQASVLALIEGNDCHVIHSVDSGREHKIDIGLLKYMFSGVSDVLHFKRVHRDEAMQTFTSELRAENALRLMLILLDNDEDVETRRDAAGELEELIGSQTTKTYVENVFYAKPIPDITNLESTLALLEGTAELRQLFLALSYQQASISRSYGAWNSLPDSLFEDEGSKSLFFGQAVRRGVPRLLAQALQNGGTAINSAIVQSLIALKDLPNYRSVVSAWVNDFKEKSRDFRDDLKIVAAMELEESRKLERIERDRSLEGFAAYKNVMDQQKAIAKQLRTGNLRLARTYADQLISNQLQSGNPELAAKTLCNLAQEANACGLYSLQLEWAHYATDIWGTDPITHAHLADAYVHLHRFDEAYNALDQVESIGDRGFAATTRANILRLQGKLDEALVAYEKAKSEFGNTPKNVFAWTGAAEVLRNMWRLTESVAAYDEALQVYPDHLPAYTAKGTVLIELGRLEEALEIFDRVLSSGEDDGFALNGKANVLKHMGKFEEALELYEVGIKRNPVDAVSSGGKANILRLMGRYDEAIKLLLDARRRFSHEPALYSELAEVHRNQGNLSEALAEYDKAMELFPLEGRISSGRANILRELGNFKEALRAYDMAVIRFPYNIVCWSGRADLLKRLRHFDDALKAYNDIITRWPDMIGAKHSKAAILVLLNRLDEAEGLLPLGEPRTLDEWIANHVRGMILLKRDRAQEAIDHFSYGLRTVPFFQERAFFENALAVAYIKLEKFERASQVLSGRSRPVSNVLLMHAYAGRGDEKRALDIYQRIQSGATAEVIELSREIARRYALQAEQPKHSDSWIFDMECQAVLLEAA